MVVQPLSQRSSSAPAKGCLVLFFLVFSLFGGVAAYFALWQPLTGLLAARSWTETQCDVLSSRVGEASSSTYRVDIRYSWTAGGSTRVGSRYDFMGGSSSGTEGKQKIVDRYPPGARVTCWVDPNDPNEAVLSRDLSSRYLAGLFPLPFLAVGLGGIFWILLSGRGGTGTAPGPAAGVSPFGIPLPTNGGAPAELKPAATPVATFVGYIFLALFWNGIVSVFVWEMVKSWKTGTPDGCLTLFLVPFVLVGIALVFLVARQLLVLFNPLPHLTLTPGVLAPGQSAFVQWRLGSGGRGVSRVLVTVNAREEARYRAGRNTNVDRETFFTLPVVDTTQPYEIAQGGSASFTLPADALPSFHADDNKIVWTLKVQCELPRWPDTEEEYEVIVQPGGTA